ncbi:MAG TPA: serine hydrolase domain-containing protein [Planctomycetota bacterium]|nr:serine hydrolase domain-containing protein [Planctomycetota bacterium]
MNRTKTLSLALAPLACAAISIDRLGAQPAAASQEPAPTRDPGELRKHIERLADAAIAEHELQGLAIVAGSGSEPLLARGWGYADAAGGVPVTEDTVFRVGSIARSFTAAAALQLAEQERLDLDAKLSELLPKFPMQGREVTVRHLLAHTSGIPSYRDLDPDWKRRGRKFFSHEELLELFQGQPFEFEPGERYAPSNSGYTLLSILIEKASGREFTDHVRRNLFLPLGLRNTHFCDEEPQVEPLAEEAGEGGGEKGKPTAGGEAHAQEATVVVPRFYELGESQALSTEDVCSSAKDLYLWQRRLAERQVLGDEGWRLLTTPVALPSGESTGHGLGLAAGELEGLPAVWQGGEFEENRSHVLHLPDVDLTVVVLATSASAPVAEIARSVARAALDLPAPGVVDLELSEEERELYAGNYKIGSTLVTVRAKDGKLVLLQPNEPEMELLFQGHRAFVAASEPETRLIFDVREGKAESFVLRRKGFQSIAKRFDEAESPRGRALESRGPPSLAR